MAQPLEIANDLVEPRLGIGRLVEARDDGLDEFARQPRDALIFGLHARRGLQHQPRHVDGETQCQHQREQQVDAPTQGQSLPHDVFPIASLGSASRRSVDSK